MACTSATTEDLEFCEGDHAESGFSSENFFTKTSLIATFPKFASDILTAAETTAATALYPDFPTMIAPLKKKTLVGDIVFKTGFKFSKFPAIVDTGSLTGDLVKEGSTSGKNEYTFDVENTIQNVAVLEEITQGILVFKSTEGVQMCLGTKEFPAKLMKRSAKHGKSSDAERKIEVTFSCQKSPYRYKGNIQLTPAV
jgi:hypothetical protein